MRVGTSNLPRRNGDGVPQGGRMIARRIIAASLLLAVGCFGIQVVAEAGPGFFYPAVALAVGETLLAAFAAALIEGK